MKTFTRYLVLVIATVPALFAATSGYNPAVVAADARWVVYVNLDGLRSSTVGKELVSAIEKIQAANTGGIIGLDIHKVLTTVGSVTAYGTNLSKDPAAIDGALIAQGTNDLRKIAESILLQGMLAEPNVFAEEKDLPFPAYSLRDHHDKSGKTKVFIAFPPEPIVIASKSTAQLLKAREVFRGNAPSLAKGGDPTFTRLASKADGAYFFSASVVPTESFFPQNAPQARMLQLVNAGSFSLGESGPDTFAHAELLASSDQSADRLSKILQGMTSMISLAESNDRQLSEFLNSTGVTREKDRVTLHLAYPSERLLQMAQTVRAHAEARSADRPPQITQGRVVAEWQASDSAEGQPATEILWRTIENVKLVNGTMITLGRWMNGGRDARWDRVEIVPAEGQGSPLTFRSDYMRNLRGTMSQFQFPGADGNYTLKVAYVNDPKGKAKFAVSVRDPNEQATPAPSPGPSIPQPKVR